MFSTSNSSCNADFLKPLEGRVTEPMNLELSKEFTREEIYKALQQMYPTKVPSHDSMPPLFFQKFWHILGSITDAEFVVLNTGHLSIDLKHTFITLILKKNHTVNIIDFWPISLCNMIYKLISKVIENRLKNISS